MKTKATLKNIAKELGVSVSTVSKSLNNSDEISDLTKKRVQEYAKLKNYKPNLTALNLKNQSTKTIGVILPNILNSFFAKVFSGIEKAAEAKGYNVITCISNESIEKEIHALNMLSNGTIDGFIVSLSEEAQKLHQFDHFKSILKEDIPIVMFDRIADEVNCDKVIVDDFESAVNATNFLIKSGCKKIAIFSSIDNLSVGKLRTNGYLKALENNKMKADDALMVLTESELDFDEKATAMLDKNKVDAIFALDEHTATAAMKMALKRGYKIPENLQIIGFADGLWSRRMTPSLSTVSQHGPEIGEAAANLLIAKLESKNDEDWKPKTTIIKTELRYRDSTRK
jgi:LacI family transcriptional regulator